MQAINYKVTQNAESLLLIGFIIYGLIGKLLICLNKSLNSDEVIAGMASREMLVHKDYLLCQYHFSSSTSNIFSDILPFHLLPQLISNFNPYAIRITAYVIFLLVVIIFSYIIFKITNEKINGLIFAALLSNLWAGSFGFYSMATSHNATLFFTGIFILLFFNKNLTLNLSSILSILLLNLIVFSDTIIIAWFVIPFIAIYILFFKGKNYNANLMVALIGLTTVITYIIKTYFISNFLSDSIYIVDIKTILGTNIPLYIKGLLYLLNESVYSVYDKLAPSDYIIIISLVLLLYFGVKQILSNQTIKIKKFYYLLIASAIIVSLAYVCTNLCIDFNTTRYLTFTAMSIYILISLSYNKKSIHTFLILLILLSSGVFNYTTVKDLDYQPNKAQFELIEYLKENGLLYGVGDYWDSNIITYLSKEQVIIRPILLSDGQILPPNWWWSSQRWYSGEMNDFDKFFLIFRSDDAPMMDALKPYLMTNQPSETKLYKNYKVFVYNQVV